jgi:hypothetical protein
VVYSINEAPKLTAPQHIHKLRENEKEVQTNKETGAGIAQLV